jgi:hypothetical protein
MMEELESKLPHDKHQEKPIFTTALTTLLTSRATAQRLKEQENLSYVRDTPRIEPLAETGAVVASTNNNYMAVVAARKKETNFVAKLCCLPLSERGLLSTRIPKCFNWLTEWTVWPAS